jgi:hypothetical protein
MISTLGWVGDVLLLWSMWEIGNKRRFAHLLTMLGEAAWIGKCLLVSPHQWDLAVICGAFFILGLRCWLKWGTE